MGCIVRQTVIFPGSFNPITFGHIDLITRSAALFDDVIVAVAEAVHKTTLFTLDERLQLTQAALAHLPNVRIISFQGLLVDLCQQYQAQAVIRGIRDTRDFEYEHQLAQMNSLISSHFETVFLTPTAQYAAISSTMVREIAALNGNLSRLVPDCIEQALRQKFNH